MNDVSVFHYVVFSFRADQTFFFCGGKRSALHEIFECDHLGADKASLKVGVDLSGGLRCLCALSDRPRTDFRCTGGEVRDQTEKLIAFLNQ